MSDRLAFGAMQTALARGLAIPGDLSIAGFDDIPEAARADPPLTTIRQPYERKGNIAATFLLEGWTDTPPRLELATEVIWRQGGCRTPTEPLC